MRASFSLRPLKRWEFILVLSANKAAGLKSRRRSIRGFHSVTGLMERGREGRRGNGGVVFVQAPRRPRTGLKDIAGLVSLGSLHLITSILKFRSCHSSLLLLPPHLALCKSCLDNIPFCRLYNGLLAAVAGSSHLSVLIYPRLFRSQTFLTNLVHRTELPLVSLIN